MDVLDVAKLAVPRDPTDAVLISARPTPPPIMFSSSLSEPNRTPLSIPTISTVVAIESMGYTAIKYAVRRVMSIKRIGASHIDHAAQSSWLPIDERWSCG